MTMVRYSYRPYIHLVDMNQSDVMPPFNSSPSGLSLMSQTSAGSSNTSMSLSSSSIASSYSVPIMFTFPPSPYTGRHVQPLIFAASNKVSPFSLEHRIDFHLHRIMKEKRLAYFKRIISGLPFEDRVNESIIEIIVSSRNLFSRRRYVINEAAALLEHLLRAYAHNNNNGYRLLADSIDDIRRYIGQISQIVWALNSNKEHVKYVAKVHCLSDVYIRSNSVGVDIVPIAMKEEVSIMVHACQAIIDRCDHLCWIFHCLLTHMILKQFSATGGHHHRSG